MLHAGLLGGNSWRSKNNSFLLTGSTMHYAFTMHYALCIIIVPLCTMHYEFAHFFQSNVRTDIQTDRLCVVTICALSCFTKTPFLEIHVAQSWFLVLGPIETDVRKRISPKYVPFPLNWTPLPNMVKWGIPEKILQNAVQTRWSLVKRAPQKLWPNLIFARFPHCYYNGGMGGIQF